MLGEKTACSLLGIFMCQIGLENTTDLPFNYQDARKFMVQNTKGIATDDTKLLWRAYDVPFSPGRVG